MSVNNEASFKLTAVASTTVPGIIFEEMCEHFVEHAEVKRSANHALMVSEFGTTEMEISEDTLRIRLSCTSEQGLLVSRTMLAEHLYYFAGKNPFELKWSEPEKRTQISNLHEVSVTRTEQITPHMIRVVLKCADITPFTGGNMHVRILVPPKGRAPVWPGLREDGRVAWPKGDDSLVVRVYTIRYVDVAARELWLDFLQHPQSALPTPGADFARDAKFGDTLAIVGPGGGSVPDHTNILLAGDESALPAIARILAEVPHDAVVEAVIEVDNRAERQELPSHAKTKITWLFRDEYTEAEQTSLANLTIRKISECHEQPYVWFAAERSSVKIVKAYLKATNHDKKNKYVAWYWEKDKAQVDAD